MFVDVAKISIKAGTGGNGAVSFRREKYVNAGGPDGGDGGKGGSVYFVVDTNISTLIDFKYKKKYAAPNGEPGRGKKQYGKAAEDLIIKVPKGTLIKDAETGRLIADMSSVTEPVLVAKGGNGGWGNTHFSTPTRQIPRFAKPGNPGQSFELILELKLLADVGLVGFPNVGKSTFISRISNAKPEIANYHFTTLSPVLGVVKIEDENSFVVADIPGLIEGASDGLGLGHEFLRHIQRCRMIVHIVDVSGIEGRDPKEDFEKINFELENFNAHLAKRPQIVVANKTDIATEDQIEEFKNYIEEKGYKFYAMSAATFDGVDAIKMEIAQQLSSLPPIEEYEPDHVELEEVSTKNYDFKVTKQDDVYIIEAEWLIRILNSCNMDDYESLQYFQRMLVKAGIIKKLEEMGIQEDDLVSIYDFEFNYLP